jgi:hypothetical protein
MARAFAPIRTRGKFWASCRHCGGTIRHDPPHATAYHDPDDADFKAFYHEDCARQLNALPEPKRSAMILKWRKRQEQTP